MSDAIVPTLNFIISPAVKVLLVVIVVYAPVVLQGTRSASFVPSVNWMNPVPVVVALHDTARIVIGRYGIFHSIVDVPVPFIVERVEVEMKKEGLREAYSERSATPSWKRIEDDAAVVFIAKRPKIPTVGSAAFGIENMLVASILKNPET